MRTESELGRSIKKEKYETNIKIIDDSPVRNARWVYNNQYSSNLEQS